MLPSDDVQIEWEQIKRKEKGYQGLSKSLHDVPKHLPALLRADRVQDKAKKFAFDFENISQICGKIEEELKEFTDALAQNDHKQAADELGDLLFSIVNMSRFLGINSEDALNKSTQKFIGRITKMEDMAFKEGSSLSEMNLNMLNDYWEKVKNKENTKE
jgi:tetrapyrrole methylase family protein/MazG family protein